MNIIFKIIIILIILLIIMFLLLKSKNKKMINNKLLFDDDGLKFNNVVKNDNKNINNSCFYIKYNNKYLYYNKQNDDFNYSDSVKNLFKITKNNTLILIDNNNFVKYIGFDYQLNLSIMSNNYEIEMLLIKNKDNNLYYIISNGLYLNNNTLKFNIFNNNDSENTFEIEYCT